MRIGAITFSLAIITAVIFASQSALAYAGGAGGPKLAAEIQPFIRRLHSPAESTL